jgi:hypothetical protein
MKIIIFIFIICLNILAQDTLNSLEKLIHQRVSEQFRISFDSSLQIYKQNYIMTRQLDDMRTLGNSFYTAGLLEMLGSVTGIVFTISNVENNWKPLHFISLGVCLFGVTMSYWSLNIGANLKRDAIFLSISNKI